MPTNSLLAPSDIGPASGLPVVDPIEFTTRADPFDDPEWLFEPEYDGFRGLVYASKLGCEIRSRQDFRFDGFADLCDRIAGILGGREVVLDGEVVALNRQGKPVFPELVRDQGFLAFAAFDLLWQDGNDLRPLPLAERKRLLTELLPEDTGPLYKILTLEEHGRALFAAIRKMDLGGIVAKRKSDPYSPSTSWYTIKNLGYNHGVGQGDVFRRRERTRRSGREE